MAPHEAAARVLGGARVLVTRPRDQAGGLAAEVVARGGEAVCVPAIEIEARAASPQARAALRGVGEGDLALFVSANAVAEGAGLLAGAAPPLRVAAVGAATARALARAGWVPDLVPCRHDSEGLLALPELGADAIAGHTVLLVKGEGGRDLLERALGQRGARVVRAEVYRRRCPGAATAEALRAASGAVDVAVITSVEGLDNLFAMAGAESAWLCALPLVVASERIARSAKMRGARVAVIAARAGDRELVDALCDWASAGARELIRQ